MSRPPALCLPAWNSSLILNSWKLNFPSLESSRVESMRRTRSPNGAAACPFFDEIEWNFTRCSECSGEGSKRRRSGAVKSKCIPKGYFILERTAASPLASFCSFPGRDPKSVKKKLSNIANRQQQKWRRKKKHKFQKEPKRGEGKDIQRDDKYEFYDHKSRNY